MNNELIWLGIFVVSTIVCFLFFNKKEMLNNSKEKSKTIDTDTFDIASSTINPLQKKTRSSKKKKTNKKVFKSKLSKKERKSLSVLCADLDELYYPDSAYSFYCWMMDNVLSCDDFNDCEYYGWESDSLYSGAECFTVEFIHEMYVVSVIDKNGNEIETLSLNNSSINIGNIEYLLTENSGIMVKLDDRMIEWNEVQGFLVDGTSYSNDSDVFNEYMDSTDDDLDIDFKITAKEECDGELEDGIEIEIPSEITYSEDIVEQFKETFNESNSNTILTRSEKNEDHLEPEVSQEVINEIKVDSRSEETSSDDTSSVDSDTE